jgi:hypothetical protein
MQSQALRATLSSDLSPMTGGLLLLREVFRKVS